MKYLASVVVACFVVSLIMAVAATAAPPEALLRYTFPDATSDTVCENLGTLGSAGNLTLYTGPNSKSRPMQDPSRWYKGSLNNASGNQVMAGDGGRARAATNIDALDGLESFTIAGWLWSAGNGMGDGARVLTQGDGGTTGWCLMTIAPNRLRLVVDGSGTTYQPDASTYSAFGPSSNEGVNFEWTFFAVTWDGSDSNQPAKFYRGKLGQPVQLIQTVVLPDSTTDLGKTDDNASLLTAVNTSAGNRAWKGFVDCLAMWGTQSGGSGALSISDLESYRQISQDLFTISVAKNQVIDTPVTCAGTVTAQFDGYFYMESTDRTSGINVSSATVYTPGKNVEAIGAIKELASGEKYIQAASTIASAGSTEIKPLGTINKSLGGGDNSGQPGITGGVGLNNIGLLVRTTGKVSGSTGGIFYINDGSPQPVKVVISGSITAPWNNDKVAVTGVVSCEIDGSDTKPVILATVVDVLASAP